MSSFTSFSSPTFPVSPPPPSDLVASPAGPFSFSPNASACLLFAVDDRVTLLSLDIGVCRAAILVAFVRVTPLGPAFAVAERNLEAFVDFVAGSLDGPGACSFTLPLPFSSGSTVSGAGGTGAGAAASGVVGVTAEGGISDGSCFSDGCGSAIVGAIGGSGSGSGAGPIEGSEVEGNSGYGSAGMGGSMETDLDLTIRWEGGAGGLEGNGKDSGVGCGEIMFRDCFVGRGLISGLDSDGGPDSGWDCGEETGGSRFIGSVVVSLSRRRGEVGGSD